MKTLNVQDDTFETFKKLKVKIMYQEQKELSDSEVLDIIMSIHTVRLCQK